MGRVPLSCLKRFRAPSVRQPRQCDRRPLVIAHRGASGIVPENTCRALAVAIDLGADMVEMDVQLSRDGCPVIFHDWNLARAARSWRSRRSLKPLRVSDLSLKELKLLDVGSWKGDQFAGLTIPTLTQILSEAAGRIALNLEIKIRDVRGQNERLRHEIVHQIGKALTLYSSPASVLISSFDRQVLELVRTVFPEGWVGVLPQPGGLVETFHLADRLSAFSVHLPCAEIRPALVRSAQRSGLNVFAYTANTPQRLKRLVAAGVDGIFTNYPDQMVGILRHH